MRIFAVVYAAAIATMVLTAGVLAQDSRPHAPLDPPATPPVWGEYAADIRFIARRDTPRFLNALEGSIRTLDERVQGDLVDGVVDRLGLKLPEGAEDIEDVDRQELSRLLRRIEETLGEEARDAAVSAARDARRE